MSFSQLLIPVKKHTVLPGVFRLERRPILASASFCDKVGLRQLADDLYSAGSRNAEIRFNAFGPAALRLRRSRTISGWESYNLKISPDSIEITSATDAGAYYGIQTLRDLMRIFGAGLPCCMIEDAPVFYRRGVYLDCSRGKVPSIKTLKELVVRLAHWKINELQLYIEDVFTFARHPAIGKDTSRFTPADIIDLQEFCTEHHIRLVGSLASFGHMERILRLPEYLHLAEMPGWCGHTGGSTLCPTQKGSIKLVEELYEEFVPLFKAVHFNICGDEPWELGRGRSKKLADRIGVGKLYIDFLLKLHDLCQKHGKRTNAWADIVLAHPELLARVPKDMVMLAWGYNAADPVMQRCRDIAESGCDFLVCPGTSSWNTHGTRLENAMLNVSEFAKQGLKYDARGLLNTDWGDNNHRNMLGVSLHSFAHAAAHAWLSPKVDDAKFTLNFFSHLLGAGYAQAVTKAVRTLGSNYVRCGAPYRNECALYHALVELADAKARNDPAQPDYTWNRSRIDSCTQAGLKAVMGRMNALAWPAAKGLDSFEMLVLAEYKLAARMDLLAAKRALLVKDVRNGKAVAARQAKQLAHDIETVSNEFKVLWLARNQQSRLCDNLNLFKNIRNEARRF